MGKQFSFLEKWRADMNLYTCMNTLNVFPKYTRIYFIKNKINFKRVYCVIFCQILKKFILVNEHVDSIFITLFDIHSYRSIIFKI